MKKLLLSFTILGLFSAAALVAIFFIISDVTAAPTMAPPDGNPIMTFGVSSWQELVDTGTVPAGFADGSDSDRCAGGSCGPLRWSEGVGTLYYNTDGFLYFDNFPEVRVENKLVAGSFYSGGTRLNVPDYVFESDYDLKSLSHVENFIKANKHLEGVPSIDEKDGWVNMSLEDRDMLLLEKIEELTLYIIDLEKRLKQLENN